MRIEAVQGDITREDVDAIVNAANSSLARGAGVCGAIFAAAGPELDDACRALGGCATGDAKVTPGFRLPARFVVHAVGPVWRGGGSGEGEALASAYRRSLEVAAEAGARSIAFPAISTGIYGFPKREAAEIAVRTLREEAELRPAKPSVSGSETDPERLQTPTAIEVARLVAFDTETYDLYRELLAR